MLDHKSEQPPNMCKKRFKAERLCNIAVLPDRDPSKIAALLHFAHTEQLRRDFIQGFIPTDPFVLARSAGPVRRIGYFNRSG